MINFYSAICHREVFVAKEVIMGGSKALEEGKLLLWERDVRCSWCRFQFISYKKGQILSHCQWPGFVKVTTARLQTFCSVGEANCPYNIWLFSLFWTKILRDNSILNNPFIVVKKSFFPSLFAASTSSPIKSALH